MAKLPVIQPTTPLPEYMRYRCKCGEVVGTYQSYQGGDFYVFICVECGRIRRFTTLVHECKFCGKKQTMGDGMMHEHSRGYGDFWMCPECANDGTYDEHVEAVENIALMYEWTQGGW